MRISFDMDGVLADLTPSVVRAANSLKPGWVPGNLQQTSWNFSEVFTTNEWENQIWPRILESPNLWAKMECYPLAIQALKSFVERHPEVEIYYVTARCETPGATVLDQCTAWLWSYALPRENVFPVKKSLKPTVMHTFNIKLSLDDLPENVRRCSKLPGHTAYLLDQPWNRDAHDLDGVRLWSVAEYLQIACVEAHAEKS